MNAVQGNKDKLILFPPQGVGDVILVCALMKEYKKNNTNKDLSLWIRKKHFYDLAKFYLAEICDVIYSQSLSDYSSLENIDVKIYAGKTFHDLYVNNKNVKSMFTKAMNIPEDAPLYYPPMEEIKDDTLSKTILIAPDAITCPKIIEDDVWLVLALMLQAKGYEVIFNTDKENRFDGFQKVFWDIETTVQKVNNMKAVISYRSGLSDVIGALCRHTPQYVIYPSKNINAVHFENEKEAVNAYFNFFSIKNAFDNDLVHEYIFNDNIIETIMGAIDRES